MRSISAICVAAAAISLAALPVRADVNTDAARASVAPFYKSLNAAFAPDSADLIRQVTTPEWVSSAATMIAIPATRSSPGSAPA
jgi:hypothetical protein